MPNVLKGGATLLGALLLCIGCAGAPRTTTVSRPFLQASDVAQFPTGGGARSAAELARLLEYNDPVGATRFFSRSWRLTPRILAHALQHGPLHGLLALIGRTLGVTGVRRSGLRTTVMARLGANRFVLVLDREHSVWKLVRIHAGTLSLP